MNLFSVLCVLIVALACIVDDCASSPEEGPTEEVVIELERECNPRTNKCILEETNERRSMHHIMLTAACKNREIICAKYKKNPEARTEDILEEMRTCNPKVQKPKVEKSKEEKELETKRMCAMCDKQKKKAGRRMEKVLDEVRACNPRTGKCASRERMPESFYRKVIERQCKLKAKTCENYYKNLEGRMDESLCEERNPNPCDPQVEKSKLEDIKKTCENPAKACDKLKKNPESRMVAIFEEMRACSPRTGECILRETQERGFFNLDMILKHQCKTYAKTCENYNKGTGARMEEFLEEMRACNPGVENSKLNDIKKTCEMCDNLKKKQGGRIEEFLDEMRYH